jgi:K+-transporting ATPase ATPase A chain
MTIVGWIQIASVLVLVLGPAVPLSLFVAQVFDGRRNLLSPVLGRFERGVYRLSGIDPKVEQDWGNRSHPPSIR